MAISGSDQSQLYAMCGVARCGATRCGDHSALAFVTVDGVLRASEASGKVQRSLSISEQAGQGANTATLTGLFFEPTEGQEVVITLGSVNNGDPIFAGRVSRRNTSQVMKDSLIYTSLNAVDYTFDANQRLVTKKYASMTADAIARDILTNFATQLSPAGIVTGLATIDEITFINETVTGALSKLAERIGGYFTISYRKSSGKPIVRLFLTTSGTNPTALSNTHATMNNFKYSADLSQVVTRVFVEGNGTTAAAAIAAGQTYLPIVSAAYFSASGGLVASGPQRISYTGAGVLAPPSAPSGSPLGVAGGVLAGTYRYKSTFVSSTGETLGSTASSVVTVASVSAPGAPAVSVASSSGSLAVGVNGSAVYKYKIAYVTAAGETLAGTASSNATISNVTAPANSLSATPAAGGSMALDTYSYVVTYVTAAGETEYSSYQNGTVTAGNASLSLTSIPTSSDARVTARKLYRRNGVSSYQLVTTISDNATTTYTDTTATSSLGQDAIYTNTSNCGQVSLSAIPTSADGRVSARAIYRTAANGSVYKRVGTISDNTTTTYADNVPDSSLGDIELAASTAGGAQVSITSVAVSSDARVVARKMYRTVSGGTVYRLLATLSDNVATSYTDTTADGALSVDVEPIQNTIVALTGVPASGAGAIAFAITDGDSVNLVAQCDDTAAQTALAALVGGDGIRETSMADRQLSLTEATALGTATLAQRSTAQVTVTYDCRDKNTRVGQDIAVSIGSVSGTFKIQNVQIGTFSAAGSRSTDPLGADLFPTYSVTASNQRYSLEDLLRQLKGRAA